MNIYIFNFLSRNISIIDEKSLEVVDEIYLNENIYPHNFYAYNGILYISNSYDGYLYLLDLKDKKIKDSVAVGTNIKNIKIHNEEIFIINEDANSIYILNLENLSPICVISVNNNPYDFDIVGEKLFVKGNNSIIIIDIKEKNIVGEIKTKNEPTTIFMM